MNTRSEWWFHLVGWLLFTGSAVLFTWSTARVGDWIGLAASLLFLVACLVFLIPVWRSRPWRRPS